MRTMHLTIGDREYVVTECGQIRRLAFSFTTPTGGCWCFAVSGKVIKSSRNKDLILGLAEQHHG